MRTTGFEANDANAALIESYKQRAADLGQSASEVAAAGQRMGETATRVDQQVNPSSNVVQFQSVQPSAPAVPVPANDNVPPGPPAQPGVQALPVPANDNAPLASAVAAPAQMSL